MQKIRLLVVIIGILFPSVIVSIISCNDGKKVQLQDMGASLDSLYMMMTDSVDLLISDSGTTKYRMRADRWYIYDREDRKEWFFPNGIMLNAIDTLDTLHKDSTNINTLGFSADYLKADTAIYYTSQKKWELIGNVEFFGNNGNKLFTRRLFWEEEGRKVYSNDTSYFITEGKELRGTSFEAVDDLSEYTILNNSGVFTINEEKEKASSDSNLMKTDSIR